MRIGILLIIDDDVQSKGKRVIDIIILSGSRHHMVETIVSHYAAAAAAASVCAVVCEYIVCNECRPINARRSENAIRPPTLEVSLCRGRSSCE